MKKSILLLMLTSTGLYGQERAFTLSGKVTDCQTHDLIVNATIKLVGSDGSSIETITDSSGLYHFDDKKIKLQTRYVVTVLAQLQTKAVYPKVPNSRGFLNSSDKFKFSTYDSVKEANVIVDFCLVKLIACGFGPPIIYFKKNASDFQNTESMNDTISFIYQILEDNPSLVFEVAGHAGNNEKNPKSLALKRAEFVKDLLIKKGIAPERLIAKSYADTKPSGYTTNEGKWIEDDKSNEKNRRVVMTIIRKDPNSKKLKKMPEEG